ncbi:TRAP transporter small permease subunit [Poseidonocella sedimentorum]
MAFYNIGYALTHPGLWLNWADPQAVMRVVYFGGSVEFFFAVLALMLVITLIGIASRPFLWGAVRVAEFAFNWIGRIAAWAGLLMVLQQVVIVFVQRIFARVEITFGFGVPFSRDISWWAEELKFYNAIIVALCVCYTFVQGGHVRVDLIYAAVGHRTKRIMDMVGSVIFMMPMAVIIWMYGWYFLWRHLIVPKPSASEPLERLLMKARAFRWNVETIGFSPNGFDAYFLFKILMVLFAGLVFIQAWAFLWRSWLELREGEEAAGKYLDRDTLGEGQEAYEGTH